MNFDFNGKRILITGGTRGIGKATADLFTSLGGDVFVTGKGLRADVANFLQADFADESSVHKFLLTIKSIAPFDILVNNAGINKISPFCDISSQDFNEILRVNLISPFELTKTILPSMIERGWGRIVNVSSIFGKISKAHRASYSASKFGLSGMTKALAAEVANKDILVNCVCPGFVDTELTEKILGASGKAALTSSVPINRLATSFEIAKTIVFLASKNNTFITGQDVVIDGGFTIV